MIYSFTCLFTYKLIPLNCDVVEILLIYIIIDYILLLHYFKPVNVTLVTECPDNCIHCKWDGSATKCYDEGCMPNFKQNADGTCVGRYM